MNSQAEELFYEHTVTNLAKYFYQKLGIVPNRHYFIRHAHAGPTLLTLALGLNPEFIPKIKALREDLAFVIALEHEQHIRLARGDWGLFNIEIPKPKDLQYGLSIKNLPPGHGVNVPLGLDGFYRPVKVNFDNPLQAHTLIAGTTGAGKTNSLRVILRQLATQNGPDEAAFLLLDPSKGGRWFRDFEGLPHLLHPIVTKQDEIAAVLTWALQERSQREETLRIHPRIFIALDEAQVILGQPEFLPPFRRLATEGREFGIHLIIVTQKADLEALGSPAIRDTLTNRVVGCVRSADEAYRVTGRKGTGAEYLGKVMGDMLFVLPGWMTRGSVPLASHEVIKEVKAQYQTTMRSLNLPTDKEIAHALDDDDNENGDDEVINGFSVRELAISLIGARYGKGMGRPWLKDALMHEMGQAPGSGRAGRLRDTGRELRAELLSYFHDVTPTARLTADR